MTKLHIITASLLTFALTISVQAQTTSLPSSGITPDSPFYFLDKWGEGLSRFFAFGKEAKAAKQTEQAEERLAEAKQMADEGKDEEAREAADAYGALISEAASNLAAAAQAGEDTSVALTDLVTKATSIHQTVLADVYEKVPEQAKPAIERAMTRSVQGQEAALNALNGTQREVVEEQVKQQRQQVEEQLDTLRQQGVPIPGTPMDGIDGITPGRPTTVPGAGSVPTGRAPGGQEGQQEQEVPVGAGASLQPPTGPGQQDAGPPAGVGVPQR